MEREKRSEKMINFILAGILLLILGIATTYVIKAKKKGVKCIGCPEGGNCNGPCGGNKCER